MGKIGKILKNKNTITILGVIACLAILYIGYTSRINSQTALIDVYYALEDIQPKTKITEDMVGRASVPASFILGEYYTDYSEIVGKYSNYNTMIAKGSLFYTSLLVEENNLPDAMLYEIEEGEKLVSFDVSTKSTYGNSIMPGSNVDIYVKYFEGEKVVYGKFFENVEIIGVKDSAGANVFESSDGSSTPAYAYFTLEEAKYLLFSSLQYIQAYATGELIEIVLVPNSMEYTTEEVTATEVTSDYLYKYVLGKLKQIDNQKELYDRLVKEMEEAKKTEEEKEQQQTQENTQQ